MNCGSIPIGFARLSLKMDWKWVGIDGKGYATTTYLRIASPHLKSSIWESGLLLWFH